MGVYNNYIHIIIQLTSQKFHGYHKTSIMGGKNISVFYCDHERLTVNGSSKSDV